MNVNLKLMHTFLLVAEHNSFCRAAQVSNRSQSAVSMQIRQLELQLGVSLFHRTTRRVELTRAGELLLDSARRAVTELQGGLQQIREAIDSQRGRLSLACASTIAVTRLPQILRAFQNDSPDVTVHVRELSSPEILECVRRQEVDFGIGPRTPNTAEFHFEPILLDEIYALVPASLAPGKRKTISLTELSKMPTFVLGGSTVLHNMLDKAQKAVGVTLSSTYDLQQVQSQIAMVTAELGAAILPRIAIPKNLGPHIHAMPIVDPPMVRELCVVSLRGQPLSATAARFVALLQRLIGQPDGMHQISFDAPTQVRATVRGRRGHLALAASQPD